jgi:hypothetical protein
MGVVSRVLESFGHPTFFTGEQIRRRSGHCHFDLIRLQPALGGSCGCRYRRLPRIWILLWHPGIRRMHQVCRSSAGQGGCRFGHCGAVTNTKCNLPNAEFWHYRLSDSVILARQMSSSLPLASASLAGRIGAAIAEFRPSATLPKGHGNVMTSLTRLLRVRAVISRRKLAACAIGRFPWGKHA